MKDVFDDGATLHWAGCSFRSLLTTQAAGGAMSITDTLVPPGFGPGRHYHPDADEAFLILEGDLEIELEGQVSLKGPGEAVFIPRGKVHAFRNPGPGVTRKVVILTPGGFEGWFAAMARGQYQMPRDMARVSELALEHGMVIVGPPMGAH